MSHFLRTVSSLAMITPCSVKCQKHQRPFEAHAQQQVNSTSVLRNVFLLLYKKTLFHNWLPIILVYMMTANTVRFWRLTTLYFKCLLPINPLTTNDTVWCRLTLATCYQLVQSVDRFCTSKRGWMGGSGRKHIQDMLCAWQLPWLSVEQPWLDHFSPC